MLTKIRFGSALVKEGGRPVVNGGWKDILRKREASSTVMGRTQSAVISDINIATLYNFIYHTKYRSITVIAKK